jgi:hypothetical protein
MQFTKISVLYEVTGYSDRRSVEKFLASLNVKLHKVGKEHCVITEDLELALALKFGQPQAQKTKKKYVASNSHEQTFLKDLQKFLSHV